MIERDGKAVQSPLQLTEFLADRKKAKEIAYIVFPFFCAFSNRSPISQLIMKSWPLFFKKLHFLSINQFNRSFKNCMRQSINLSHVTRNSRLEQSGKRSKMVVVFFFVFKVKKKFIELKVFSAPLNSITLFDSK